jgi:hypothetical protein
MPYIHFHLCFQKSRSFLKILLLVLFLTANAIRSEEIISPMIYITVVTPRFMLVLYKSNLFRIEI